jgi:hypothetical protein
LTIELLLERLPCPTPFYAYAMALPSSLSARAADLFALCIGRLSEGAVAAGLSMPTLWLDTQNLHKDGGSKLLSANARRWEPSMGFCFDPTSRAPRKLQISDLMDMEYGSALQLDDRTAIHVANLQESSSAYRIMAGRGLAVLLFFGVGASPGAIDAAIGDYMRNSQRTLRPLMAPGEFQSFPFYLSLLTPQTVSEATTEQLGLWLGSADLYVRESDDHLLMLSRREMAPILTAAGLRQALPTDLGAWVFPESILDQGKDTA